MTVLCWTCGVECTNREELGVHMLEAHEADADYIKCPQCCEPVVDLLLHWETAHAAVALPGGVALRASKAPSDFRRRWLRQKRRSQKFKEGFFPSPKNGGRQLHYRSGWERTVYKILEGAFSVARYEPEPFPIHYRWQGLQRRYWPDIRVTFIDGTSVIVEIKPLAQCPDPDGGCDTPVQALNEAKWQAAEAWCRSHGTQFIVWTENAIKRFSRMPGDRLTKDELLR